ncbi:NUDIX hydrolase [Denitrobaculum tricleocarpae]|uniref:NUDIX domain-containing protein n=1 Tax=Denitrobaculum tricleocarpae TaxID=2591009 RepID=A0A545T5F4_9PROT|nr:NUDIX hydrolase [Denitrobaculum tricleocarpae]TQV72480.1 NUDIX domain-containing protein [Denitrobaculum tricleocarpae]
MTERPIPAALAVVVRGAQLLLVRRNNRPNAGLWGFPGGKIELGETVMEAAVRELQEETGVEAEARETLTSVDVIIHNNEGALEHHYVLVAILCEYISGAPLAADDVSEAEWFDYEAILANPDAQSPAVGDVARQAMMRLRGS